MTAVMEHRVELYSRRYRRLVLFGTLGIRHAFIFVRGADMSGIAQGSILEPDLWNASNNNLVKLSVAEKSGLLGYADAAVQSRLGYSRDRSTDGF